MIVSQLLIISMNIFTVKVRVTKIFFLTFVSNFVGKVLFKTKVLMIHQNIFVRQIDDSYSSTTTSEEWKQKLILSDHRGSMKERREIF